nr:glycoside hydrolase family 76 protein [Herbihabitans rhizosphaerae]
MPRTVLGMAHWPPSVGTHLHRHWNYWWQAHLLDCLVDAQLRHPVPARVTMIERLMRGIRRRNGRSWTNDYYDDMAWLGLALLRAETEIYLPCEVPIRQLLEQLRDGWTDHAGGGIWWRRGDDFKNVPANAPAAILLARWARLADERVDAQRAIAMVDWMEELLLDRGTGLLHDGLHVSPDGGIRGIETAIYTYCQGAFLGACLELAELGHQQRINVRRAERTISAVAEYLSDQGVLHGQGGGDGGLFAGITARYLAQAALRMPAMGSEFGELAAGVVFASAEAAWRNRGVVTGGPLISPQWTEPAMAPRSTGSEVAERDLSVQLSGWTLFEAAALLERT